ncbi:MAG: hypothetical protein AB2693_27680 [Candidatus Thiodiazotropha sp.]
MIKILELYRDNDDPDLCDLSDGRALATLKQDEVLSELKKRRVDGLKLCRIGLIDPQLEQLCRLLHYAIGLQDSEAATKNAEENKKLQSPRLRNR